MKTVKFVKIGHSYFNPMRIDRIRADVTEEAGLYTPIVKVYLPGKAFYFDVKDVFDDDDVRSYDTRDTAMAYATPMVREVRDAINKALEE